MTVAELIEQLSEVRGDYEVRGIEVVVVKQRTAPETGYALTQSPSPYVVLGRA